MTTFADLDLAEPLSRALTALDYSSPTPIQVQAIPLALAGRDLFGIAQTGTGKTAAFALPALDHLCDDVKDPPKRGARILVLAPTRELVAQIADSFADYGRFIEGLSVARVTGGVPMARQIKKLVGGNDVLVATPGRLIDLLDRKAVRLDEVEILVLDEADQMMDMGFIHALKAIVPHLPAERQTVLFSATLAPKIKRLAEQFLNDPVHISVAPANTTAEKVTQRIIFAESPDKPALLAHHLLTDGVGRALVFTRTKHGADRLVKRLARMGLPAVAIHGNRNQSQRTRALNAFKDGSVPTLVATDVAARGIDIPAITHVFNYEIPNVAEQYVHRIGRTARADASGDAVSFVAKDERAYLKDIQKLLGETLPTEGLPGNFEIIRAELASRDPIERVNLTPDQPKRQGRGKGKKKRGPKASRNNSESKTDTPTAKPNPEGAQPKPRKPKSGKSTGKRKSQPSKGNQPGRKPSSKPGKPKGKPNAKPNTPGSTLRRRAPKRR